MFNLENKSQLMGPLRDNWHFLVISIVIDSDRGHCYKH